MRIPRMAIKHWMICVAVLAVPLSRPARFHYLALEHQRAIDRLPFEFLDYYLLMVQAQGERYAIYQERISRVKPLLDFSQYHWSMREKYEDAARRPWLPVASDPSRPPVPTRECLMEARRILDEFGVERPEAARKHGLEADTVSLKSSLGARRRSGFSFFRGPK